MNAHLAALEPRLVWQHFRTLCNTPRPSGHEAALVATLEAWADAQGLTHDRDAFGNLRIRKPATPGCEDAPGIVLQGHLDMVAQANSGHEHDFTRDPIRTVVKEGWLYAEGTTLGADNGMGVAAILAVLEDPELTHGPLEALFTLEEETSMGGALNLAENWLEGSLLLNLDSEDRGEVYIGCAGGADVVVDAQLPSAALQEGEQLLSLSLTGLKGGHSGMDIHKPLGNANRLLVRVLWALEAFGARLVSYQGGTLRNAIPREAFAQVALPADDMDAALAAVEKLAVTLKAELGSGDSGLVLTATRAEQADAEPLTLDASAMLLAALHAAPCGVERMSADVPGVVETSNNLGVLSVEQGRFHLCALVRSLHDSAAQAMAERFQALFGLMGARVKVENGYPGWAPNPDSPLLATFKARHAALMGHEPEVKVIHAGLECGILGSKYPHLDMISFGPLIRGAHSPDERVEIESVAEFWAMLRDLVAALAK
ncbi:MULTISPECIES: aminoacyl-histidine dipeptidase [Halomonadaceae]|uniref:Cytosol non-specific dipeptidase n=1 Tax=Vreelandella aquamarina TaxID=77097 RepID=A0A1H8GRA4_9GAMM|nr:MULTISPECIES: aminoacyl-histidine dipeptidase [Halomonas]MCO7243353.1 aminoacyl-histidine dipeptidase [Halomonas sp. Ps84H-12]MEE3267234.1 aminoacyl-histidine dipeptidase [Pseudomonadota bacterium]SEN46375.1 dipeptidase D [Halomonas aquamarina]HBK36115.1 aminoacyl-histidine dipeptidase [Halomonas sp.]|tara:strand:- start:806 stop:2263 length:1458 start_codon:yes stop_codon:yes gene_type:complete